MRDPLDMSDDRSLLVSVKPVYARLILAGSKTVELRRVRPHAAPGCQVLIYASSPTMEMVGSATLAAVDSGDVDLIWARYGPATGIDRRQYDAYFEGTDAAVALVLTQARALRRGVPLAELRRRVLGFQPPQSFRYLGHLDAAAVV